MKNIFLLLSMLTLSLNLNAQCPGSLTCEVADVLCSISQLNGFTCNNPTIPNTDFPFPNLCFGVGVAHNLNWWAFVGCGEPLSITFNFDPANCETGQGIQAGVFEANCDGSQVWDCNGGCNSSTFTLSGPTKKCETYYVWVDGCNGDICNYTISTIGSDCSPQLPPLSPLATRDKVCPCNMFEVCAPDLGECEPSLVWKVDGVEQGRDECIDVIVPEDAMAGQIIEVCLIAVIGNPDSKKSPCDIDSICTDFIVQPIQKDTGDCVIACFEKQPLIWHGLPITSNCVSPPCSVRAQGPDGCCVDSFKSFILLPPPGIGIKDTFICDANLPYIAENGKEYYGEVCDELIEFQKTVTHPSCSTVQFKCDTSYLLNIDRLILTGEWQLDCALCSGKVSLCPNIEYLPHCSNLPYNLSISLDWYEEKTGDSLGVTAGDSCMEVDKPGRYCFKVISIYDGTICTLSVPICIDITKDFFDTTKFILADSIICKDSFGIYEVATLNNICEYKWIVNGSGTITTPNPNDTSRIQVKWDSLKLDTAQVCVQIKTDCSNEILCKDVFICPKPSSTSNNTDDFTFFYSIQSQSIYWSDLEDFNNIKLTILDLYGRPVLSTKIRDSEGRMGISKLNSGVYMIILSDRQNNIKQVLKCALP